MKSESCLRGKALLLPQLRPRRWYSAEIVPPRRHGLILTPVLWRYRLVEVAQGYGAVRSVGGAVTSRLNLQERFSSLDKGKVERWRRKGLQRREPCDSGR